MFRVVCVETLLVVLVQCVWMFDVGMPGLAGMVVAATDRELCAANAHFSTTAANRTFCAKPAEQSRLLSIT